jgi:hypothetical protein
MSKIAQGARFSVGLIAAVIIIHPLFPIYAADSRTINASQSGTKNERVEIKDQIDDFRSSLKTLAASRQASLKTKLATFKDQAKAQIAQRVSDNLNQINQRRTAEMTTHLSIMTKILDRVQAQASASATTSASASASIAGARKAISTAQSSVDAQSQKDYTLTVTSEATVRAQAKADRDKLFADLKVSRDLVIAAKQAVANAIRSVAANKTFEKGAGASTSATTR